MKKLVARIYLWLILILISQSFTFAANELEQINQAIAAKGANWVAGENWVTRLSPAERRRLCGSLLEPPDPSQAKLLSIPLIDSLPAHLDWRNNNGNWVTPVKDQGNCGSCWDFAAVGQVESWWKIHHANLDSMLDLSEQFVLSCSDGSCDGWDPAAALEFIKTTGVPTETCFKYEANDQIPCSEACSDWKNQAIKIPGWGYITLEEDIIANIKNAIYRHPVTASFTVYEDFSYYAGGVYEHVWGDVEGGHAIVIVGWDDSEQSWICKNSWGRMWGENGYFRIKWSNCGMGSYLPFIWDELTGGPAISLSPDHFNLNLTFGDSIVQNITINNKSKNVLEFSSMDYGGKIMFHPDHFNAWQDLSWWCGDPEIGGYDNHVLEYMDTPILDLSNTATPYLSWMGYWSIEDPAGYIPPYDGWDGCNVWISADGGKNFTVATPISPAYNCQSMWSFGHPEQGWNMGIGIPGWGGSSGGWIPVEFDLTSYKSDSVIIRYAFASDLALCTLDDPMLYGLFVDEIVVADGDNIIFEDRGNYPSAMKRTGRGGSANADWIDILNGSNVIMPHDSAIVGISINTRKMIPGSFYGLINVTSNDTTQPLSAVTFNLELQAPEHDISVDEVWFPGKSLILLSSVDLGAKISNTGLKDEQNFDVVCTVSNQQQTIYIDTSHVSLIKSGESQNIKFEPFLALQTGEFDFVIKIINLQNDYNAYNNLIQSKTSVTNLVDNFETETDFWTYASGWGLTDRHSAYSGNFSAHINSGETPYSNNMDAIMTFAQGFDFRFVDNATLKFWTRYNIEKDNDICYVEASVNNLNWIKIDSISGIQPAWRQHKVELTDFIKTGNHKVWIRFHFISNEQDTRFGLFIDDVEIYFYPSELPSKKLTIEVPDTWNLTQNFPNPFNMNTRINYSLPEPGKVSIAIYNIQGQMVRNLIQAYQTAGHHFIEWDGCDDYGQTVGTGIYFYHVEVAGKFEDTRKMILMK